MKTENKNQFEAPERKHYKKRYLVRRAEEAEAEKEIETFDREEDIESNETSKPSLDNT